MRKLNIQEVKEFIEAQSPESKIYIGGDSERFMINNVWHADIVVVFEELFTGSKQWMYRKRSGIHTLLCIKQF